MHLNFYHWHAHAELQPDTNILKPRWDAAAKFAEEILAKDACALIRIALFPGLGADYIKHFSDELVKLEPTFPTEKNAELLRVMATAALYGRMETESVEADAIALGLQASAFPLERIQPVCKELMQRAQEYLMAESERVRPGPDADGDFQAFTDATLEEGWADEAEVTKLLGEAVLELGETMKRVSEENQFLWWLLGRRSSLLSIRRERLAPIDYALVVAAEAADRVALIPPASSVESLIDEVLTQCTKTPSSPVSLTDIVDAANLESLKAALSDTMARELVPITTLLGIRRGGGKIDTATLKNLKIPPKLKVTPSIAANQYFHELMFLKALKQLV